MTRPARAFALVLVTVAIAAAVVGLPVYLIRPMAPQTADGVALAYRLKAIAAWLTPLLGVVALICTVAALRTPARSRGGAALRAAGFVVLLVAHGGAIWFTRQNHFEWMFRPFPDPRFVSASAATDVAPDEPVIGVARGADALAFPITRIGYHHLVNATLGDVPIVATY